jgi:glutathione S-transferase
LGMLDEEETKCAELVTELESALAGRYFLMEQRPTTVDAWVRRMKRRRFHHFAHAPRSLCHPRQKCDAPIATAYSSLLRKFD